MYKLIVFLGSFLLLLTTMSFGQKACCTNDKSTYEKVSNTTLPDTIKVKEKDHYLTEKEQTNDSASQTEIETKAELTVFNEVCPVMGKKVDLDGAKVEYNGKLYAFCCDGCETKFSKNPEKYLKNLSEDGKKFLGKKRS